MGEKKTEEKEHNCSCCRIKKSSRLAPTPLFLFCYLGVCRWQRRTSTCNRERGATRSLCVSLMGEWVVVFLDLSVRSFQAVRFSHRLRIFAQWPLISFSQFIEAHVSHCLVPFFFFRSRGVRTRAGVLVSWLQ